LTQPAYCSEAELSRGGDLVNTVHDGAFVDEECGRYGLRVAADHGYPCHNGP